MYRKYVYVIFAGMKDVVFANYNKGAALPLYIDVCTTHSELRSRFGVVRAQARSESGEIHCTATFTFSFLPDTSKIANTRGKKADGA